MLTQQSKPTMKGNADDDDDEFTALIHRSDYPRNNDAADQTLRSYTIFSFLFAANPSAALACLSLATARLGSSGALSSGVLYLTYTLSSVMGATYVVKKLGSRNAMIVGMSLYCCYVGCFWAAVSFPNIAVIAVISGAFFGGIGAGILWTAQGSYFASAAEEHALNLGCDWTECTSLLSGIFAFAYLIEETILHVSSYFLLQWGVPWTGIFALYTMIAILSTVSIIFVKNYPPSRDNSSTKSQFYNVTVALNLLFTDKKMPFLVGLSAAFGFAGAFLNSFVSGQVIRLALDDADSKFVGLFVSWAAFVAAISSLIFGRFTHDYGKAPVMIIGNAIFIFVALPFILRPDLTSWTWQLLLLVYTCQGLGRATFESTVKATFADMYPHEKEGAFANIILQNGFFGSIGYVLTFSLLCPTQGPYCIEYQNGTLHDVLTFERIVCLSAVIAVAGYLRALSIYREERKGSAEECELKKYQMDSINAFCKSQSSRQCSRADKKCIGAYMATDTSN